MRALAVVVAAVVVALEGIAAADPSVAVPEDVSVIVEGGPTASAIIFVDDAHLLLPAEVLCQARLCPAGGLDRDGVRYIDLKALANVVSYRLDEDKGELRIHIDPAALPETVVRLGNHAPANLTYPTSPSLFVNYAASTAYHAGDGPDSVSLSGFGEAGFAAHDTLVYSAVSASDTQGAVRGLSNIAYDDRASMRRYTAGDSVVIGGVLGGGGVIGGLHLARDFGLDPYFVSQPTLTQSGVVTAPSTIEIYRDGQLIRREAVPAGPFRVQDIASAGGIDTQVIVRNPLGVAQLVMTSTALPPPNALAPGLDQYDLSIGFVRSNLVSSSFDYGAPGLLGVYRRGITPLLTLGGRLEASTDRASAGASILATHDHATVEATLAASVSDQGVSPALAVNFGWRERKAMFALLGRVVGAHYSTLDLGSQDDRAIAELDATATTTPTMRTTLSMQVGIEQHSLVGMRSKAMVSGGVQVGGLNVAISTGVAYQQGQREIDGMVTLTRSFGPRTVGSASVSHDANGDAVAASMAHAVLGNRGFGYDANAHVGQTTTAGGRVDYEHDYGRAEVMADWLDGSGRVNLDVSGGIVAIGGVVKATRPVEGGFALVRVPGASNVRTYLDNHEIGTTDKRGDIIVPDLQPFYANHLRIDVRDLPLDVSTRDLERVIAPPRRGGAVVELAPQHSAFVVGNAVAFDRGEPVDLDFAEIIVDGTIREPVGKGGVFELDSVLPGSHRAIIEIEGRHCTFNFTVDESLNRVELGHVRCTFSEVSR